MNNKRSYVKWYVFGIIITCIVVFSVNAIPHINRMINRNIAATRLTDDRLRHGPIEFKGEVYFPSSYKLPEDKYTEVLGIILYAIEGKGAFRRFKDAIKQYSIRKRPSS